MMSLTLILALQAAPDPIAITPSDFDLARLPRYETDLSDPDGRRACARAEAGDSDTITVCGSRRSGNAYPMAAMDRRYGPRQFIAETGVTGNLWANVHVDAATMPDGTVSNRVMFGLRLPF